MRPLCRLCANPASEGSSLCGQHREAAARFSVAFAPDNEAAATATDGAPAIRVDDDPLAASLTAALTPACQQLEARLAAGALDLGRRWPQLSCYFLAERLFVRSYLSIVPAAQIRAIPPTAASPWTAALVSGGALYNVMLEELRRHAAALHGGALQTLDLHLLVYADAAVLNAQTPGREAECLRALHWRDAAWQPATLAALRVDLGHDRWREPPSPQSA